MAESFCSLIGGIVFAFIFSWKVALVSLAITPFMIIGSAIGSKVDKSNITDDKNGHVKVGNNGDLLANDAIQNYRTVAGFGLTSVIIKEYIEMNATSYKT